MKFVPRLPETAKRRPEPSLEQLLQGTPDVPLTAEQRAGISVHAQLLALDRERHEAGAAARAEEAKAVEAETDAAYDRYLKRAGRASRFDFNGARR